MTTRDYLHAFSLSAQPHHLRPPSLQNRPMASPPQPSNPLVLPGLGSPDQHLLHHPPATLLTVSASASPLLDNSNGSASHADHTSTDKEEGELSDAEPSQVSPVAANFSLSQPPTGPKNPSLRRTVHRPPPSHSQSGPPPNAPTGPRSPFSRPHSANRPSTNQPPAEQRTQQPSRLPELKSSSAIPEPTPAEPASTPARLPPSQREHAMVFIASWHRSGHTFQQLVDEGFDPQILKNLYDASGIPVPKSPPPQPSVSQHETAASNPVEPQSTDQPVLDSPAPAQDRPMPTIETNAVASNLDTINTQPDTSNQPSSAPTPTDAPDRQSYIARLMAAKSKKPAVDKHSPPATNAQPVAQQIISLPNPPPAEKACMALMNLCKTAGFSLPSFEWGERKGKAFVSRLVIKQLPSHISQWLDHSAATLHQQWSKGNPYFSLPNNSTLEFKHEGLTKQSTKREGARICYSLLATAIDTTGHEKQRQSANSAMSAHNKDTSKSVPMQSQAALTPAQLTPTKPETSNDNSPADEDAMRAAAKRKAQTELLRKKMEALKSGRLKNAPAPTASSETESAPPLPDTHDYSADNNHKENGTPTDTGIHPHPSLNGGVPLPHPPESTSNALGLPIIAPSVTSPSTTGPTSSEHANPPLSTIPISFEISSSASNRVRKRPVAADFNDDVEPPVMKRPFGQLRGEEDESMIIEASEDETEPGHNPNSGTPELDLISDSANPYDTSVSRKLASSGPLRSAPAGRRLQLPDRTLTPVSPGSGFDRHQEDILAMKRKIAELEKKRKSKLLSSAPATPGSATPNPNASTDQSNPTTDLRDKLDEKSDHSPVPSEVIEEQAESGQHADSPRIAASISSEVQSADPSPAKPDWRHRRRAEIQSDLPGLDARSAQDSRELERLREQMERIRDEMKKREEDKQRLIEELESLGVETEGMAHTDLQATKDSLASQPLAKRASVVATGDVSSAFSEPTLDNAKAPPIQSVASSSASSMSISSVEESPSDEEHPASEHAMESMAPQSDSRAHTPSSIANSEIAIAAKNLSKVEVAAPTNGDLISPEQPKSEPSRNVDHIVEQGNATTSVSGSSAHYADDESMGSSDDSNRSENVSLETTKESNQAVGYQPPTTKDSSYFPGDSEDEYEPSDEIMRVDGSGSGRGSGNSHLDRGLTEGMPAETEKSEQNDSSSTPLKGQDSGGGSLSMDGSDGMEESEDEYDPVDNFQPVSKGALRGAAKEYDEMREDVEEAVNGSSVQETGYPATQIPEPNNDINESPKISVEDLPEAERFKPYQSGLHHFRSSRPSSYFSSNAGEESSSPSGPYKMDHKLPLCPFELAGGVCNDDKCEYQHLGKLRLAGSGGTRMSRSNVYDSTK